MEQINSFINQISSYGTAHTVLFDIYSFIGLIILAYAAYFIANRIILRMVEHFVHRSGSDWDDTLVRRGVFRRLSHFAPAIVIYVMASVIFQNETVILVVHRIAQIYMLLIALLTIDAFLSSVVDIYRNYSVSQKMPIKSMIQVVKIVVFTIISIVILSIIIGRSPAVFIGGIGAMTAVLMLIFKDPILGFAAGIQLSANNMVRIGDWIEMPKFGADGDVIDISLTTVKVQNWDKTISTIPTFALVSEGVKNWRGMSESGGRRIKRAINIDMSSVKFCTEEMLYKFRKFQYITEYIEFKRKELSEYNQNKKIDDTELVNGRRLTNIGTFRAYLSSYLRDHPKINKNLTFLIRQLDPGPNGMPIEVYVFSNDQVWANYEAIQADIFDHILAVIPEFELRVFQNPTGADFKSITHADGV
jgi:miniconductance mechanosensitive channel